MGDDKKQPAPQQQGPKPANVVPAFPVNQKSNVPGREIRSEKPRERG
jgi:hypothetical protein